MATSRSTSSSRTGQDDFAKKAEEAFERATLRTTPLPPEERVGYVDLGIRTIRDGARLFPSWLAIVQPSIPGASEFQLRLIYEHCWKQIDDPDELRPPDPADFGILPGYLERAIEGAEAWKSRLRNPSPPVARIVRLTGVGVAVGVFVFELSADYAKWIIVISLLVIAFGIETVLGQIAAAQDRKQKVRYDRFNPDPDAYKQYARAYADYQTSVAPVYVSRNGKIHFFSSCSNMWSSWEMPKFRADRKGYVLCMRCGGVTHQPQQLPPPFGPAPLVRNTRNSPPTKFSFSDSADAIVTVICITGYGLMLFDNGSRTPRGASYGGGYGHSGGRSSYGISSNYDSSFGSGSSVRLTEPSSVVPIQTYGTSPEVKSDLSETTTTPRLSQITPLAPANPTLPSKRVFSNKSRPRVHPLVVAQFTDAFTLGSDEATVKRVQGVPTRLSGDEWHYDLSSISFQGGVVVGWRNYSHNLHVRLSPAATSEKGTFTIGSSVDEVLSAQGTPSGISGNEWWYELSTITFDERVVAGWRDYSHNLRVHMVPTSARTNKTFTLGSTPDEVITAQGTPSGVSGDEWWYELSNVTFDNGVVIGWRDYSQNLNDLLKPKVRSGKSTFTIGSTRDEVLSAQGTPSGVSGTEWWFGLSNVSFQGDAVVSYHDYANVLHLR